MYRDIKRKVVIGVIGAMIALLVWGVYIYREAGLSSVKMFSDVSGSVLNTLIHSYSTGGFTEEEVSTLVKFVSRSIAQMVFPHLNVKSIEIMQLRYDNSTFEAYNIKVVLDRATIFIDNLVYDGKKLSLQFSVSTRGNKGLLRCESGDVCIVYWEDGRWYRR